jgi:glutamate dehydrogenase (NADP+)
MVGAGGAHWPSCNSDPLLEDLMSDILKAIIARDPWEREFHQAVREVIESIEPVLKRNPHYAAASILERITEPERVVTFRVPWVDDQGKARTHRGYLVEMNSAIGPYKGGLRFHPSVNQGILKFLAFEQVFKNALTPLPLGGGAGGTDFEPKGRSDDEVMRFCQSFVCEMYRHIGHRTDIPGGDIGVGAREIGFLFGALKKLTNRFTGALTGKGLNWGGSLFRPEAAGYGCVYFAAEMLATRGMCLEDQVCLVSGSGSVAQHTAEKLIALGAKVVTLSDSSGHIYDPEGLDAEKLQFVKVLKNIRRGRIREAADRFPGVVYTAAEPEAPVHPIWRHRADCVFPCATQNEIGEQDAYSLINNTVKLVCEGANMPCSSEAIDIFTAKNILFAPGKAANAGGVAVSGLEMVQNSMRLSWLGPEVDERLRIIIKEIHNRCLETAEIYGTPGNYLNGANIAAFVRVVDAMLDQGVV